MEWPPEEPKKVHSDHGKVKTMTLEPDGTLAPDPEDQDEEQLPDPDAEEEDTDDDEEEADDEDASEDVNPEE